MLLVVLVALAIRVALAIAGWHLPIIRTPKLDSAEYVLWARRIAAGDFAWPTVSQHGPGYPFFLAAVLAIASGSLHAALFAQAILGAATAGLVAAVTTEWFGVRAGVFAGLGYAMYGPAVWIDTTLVSEGLLLFLLALALYALRREPLALPRAAAAGAALGAAALVRPTAVVIAGACVLWIPLSVRRRQARAMTMAAVLAGGCFIVALPVLAQNWSTSRIIGIQSYGGLNVYIGNSPLHSGRATFRLGGAWDALNSEASRAGISDPAAQDRYYIAKTFTEIREHPASFVTLLATKALWLLQAEESRDSHSYYFFIDRLPLLRVLPRMALLLPLAAIGLVPIVRAPPPRRALLLYVAAASAATAVFLVVGTRYRMPFVMTLAICAGVGADTLVTVLSGRRVRELIACGSAAAVAVAISHVLSDPRDRNISEEWAFTGSALITEHDLPGAETAYRRALELDPSSSLAWDGLGLAYFDSGRLGDARRAFVRATSIAPENARAVFHLSLVDERQGRVNEAAAGYRRALDLMPFDLDATEHLARVLMAQDKAADAVPYLRTWANQKPSEIEPRRLLATALAMTGDVSGARAEMQRVVDLTPNDAEAWLDLCLLSLDLHDVNTASAALQRARELGADAERLRFAAAALSRMAR